MKPTHKRRVRFAECVQFDGVTMPRIPACSATLHNGSLILRQADGRLVGTLRRTDWVVIGEDRKMRMYDDVQFRVMYEVLR